MQKEYDQNHRIGCLRQWRPKAGFPALGECSLAVHRKWLKLQQSVHKAGCPKEARRETGQEAATVVEGSPAMTGLSTDLPSRSSNLDLGTFPA